MQGFLTCLYAQITGKNSLREIERGSSANHNYCIISERQLWKSTPDDAEDRRNLDCSDASRRFLPEQQCALEYKFRFHDPLIPATARRLVSA